MRLPFLNQPIQGDDVYFLAAAQHAQIDPLHPNHTRYPFLGTLVDMRGHPHPPLNGWLLGGLLLLFGEIREVPFHAAYALLSLLAAAAAWSLAKRFSPQPVLAALTFLATPVLLVNGNSLEADLPHLAFWTAGVALFVSFVELGGALRGILAAFCLGLCSLAAFQAVFLTPILLVYVWLERKRIPGAVLLTLTPPVTLGAWQLFEYASSGSLPAGVLSGYLRDYGWLVLTQKLRNGAALSVHFAWLVFTPLLFLAVHAAWKRRSRGDVFLAAWIAFFFAGALAVFFAGSARYLLPLALPLAIWVSYLPPRIVRAGAVLQASLGLALAASNYQHWDGYRRFAASIQEQTQSRRVWVNGEWGLRFYLEADGGVPLLRGQPVRPGELVVSSELAYPVAFTTGGGQRVPLSSFEIRPTLPFRLLDMEGRSAYSTVNKAFWPFVVSSGPADRIHAQIVVERAPELEFLPMNAPAAESQIVSGVHDLESGAWRWTTGRAVFLLKPPEQPSAVEARFVIPDASPVRTVTLEVNGVGISRTFPAAGTYQLKLPSPPSAGASALVALTCDKTFSVPGDQRVLGVILTAVGFLQ